MKPKILFWRYYIGLCNTFDETKNQEPYVSNCVCLKKDHPVQQTLKLVNTT